MAMTRVQQRNKKMLLGLFHLVCLSVYMIPILRHTFTLLPPEHTDEIGRVAVLDESHIMSENNLDINGDNVPLATIFTNDYWGRPMNSPSSHKSWRPLTVLSFRWLRMSQGPAAYQLLFHRLFNIVTHAAIADLVGGLAVELVKGFLPATATASSAVDTYVTLLFVITKALFVLHPTHVEVTANAANRPHLLGAMCAVLLSNPNLPWTMFLVVLLSGYLSSETFLFTLPPIVITLTLIVLSQQLYNQQRQDSSTNNDDNDNKKATKNQQFSAESNDPDDPQPLVETVVAAVLPRTFILLLSAFAYFGGRYAMDWLNIPEGLIRPAENPFYRLEGSTRFRSYFYVLAVHIAKSWSMDIVGFSHEYGHACILPVTEWDDIRFTGTVFAAIVLGFAVLVTLLKTYNTRPLVSALIILQLSWMATLFPISGIVKVGTFISDRIVVASTVSTCIVLGVLFTTLIVPLPKQEAITCMPTTTAATDQSNKNSSLQRTPFYLKYVTLMVVVILSHQWIVIHKRTMEWMGWIPLLNSALKTCPKFAKAHLELSKISNGLYKEEFNLTRSRWHVEQAEKFDPNFCDVHQQYAQIAIQENNYFEFESHLSKAVTCTFTTGWSWDTWQRYWKMTLDPQQNPNPELRGEAQKRYQGYMKEIQKAVDEETKRLEEEERMQKQKKKSPFVWDKLRS